MRGREWERAVQRHLIPQLPGQWRAWTWVLYMEPMDWFTQAVIVSIVHLHIQVTASVQLLAAPREWWVANLSIHLGGYGRRWPIPSTTVDAETILDDLAPLIRAEAVPFFEENATLDGYLAYLNGRVSSLAEQLGDGGWQDVGIDEELTYVHLLRRRHGRGRTSRVLGRARWTERRSSVRPGSQETSTTDVRRRDQGPRPRSRDPRGKRCPNASQAQTAAGLARGLRLHAIPCALCIRGPSVRLGVHVLVVDVSGPRRAKVSSSYARPIQPRGTRKPSAIRASRS